MNGLVGPFATGYTVCVELALLAFVIAVVVIDVLVRRERPAAIDETLVSTQKIIVDQRNRR